MLIRSLLAALTAAMLAAPMSAQVPFQTQDYGPSCGPTASGEVTPNGATYRFAFTYTGTEPRTPVLLIVGVNAISFPINFGASCEILTELAFTQVHMSDTAASYVWSHAMPSWFQSYIRVQFAQVTFDALNNLIVHTSNGVYMYYTG